MYEELVKRLREESEIERWLQPHSANETPKLLDDAADAIEELTDRNVGKWIPVTKRLPKDGEFVLVCNDDKHMMIAKYETETYEWYYKYTNYDFDIWDNEEQGPVCYWMPLPEWTKEET